MCLPPLTPPVRFQAIQRIHCAEQHIAGFGVFLRAGRVIEQPAQFEAGKIGRQRQAGLGAQAILSAVLGEFADEVVGARVHPDQRIVKRLACAAIPDDGRLALVGDADADEIGGAQTLLRQGAANDRLGVAPDLRRIVFDPSRPGSDLFVFLLVQ